MSDADWLRVTAEDIAAQGEGVTTPPVLTIGAADIPDVARVMDYWRQLAAQAGLPGLHLVAVNYRGAQVDPADFGMDASTWQPLPPKSDFSFGEDLKLD